MGCNPDRSLLWPPTGDAYPMVEEVPGANSSGWKIATASNNPWGPCARPGSSFGDIQAYIQTCGVGGGGVAANYAIWLPP